MLPIASSTVAKFTSAFSFLEFLFFFAGASNGIKERWAHHTTDGSIFLVVIIVSGIVLISLVTYLGECKHFGKVLSHLWMGVLFSVLSFTEIAFDRPIDSLQDLDSTDILVITSTGFHVLKTLTVRICGTASYESIFLSTEECMYLLGFLCTTGMMDFASRPSMLTITVAVTVHLMAFHMKSSVTLLSACCVCFLGSVYFFPAIDVHCNPYILSCFIVHLFFESVIDIYFSRLSLLGTWKKFIFYGYLAHRLQILVISVLEAVLFYGLGMQLFYEPELPVYRKLIFILMSIYWVPIHIMFILTCWRFVGKLEECANIADSTGNFSDSAMSHIMASQGVRHLCLVLINVTFCTIISTVIAIASSWQGKNPCFIGMMFIVLPVELLVHDFINNLGKSVGGTAIGYSIVVPDCKYSPTGEVIGLAESVFQFVYTKATELNFIVSRFFKRRMIYIYGADFLPSGISADEIEKKITSFFHQCVLPSNARLHYDTYILYYSGPVKDNGDWLLRENKTLSLNSILTWWRNTNAETGARLILLLDSSHSHKWVNDIWQVENDFIAIQTGKLTATFDAEEGDVFALGTITKLWDNFNTSEDASTPEHKWDEDSAKVDLVYGVSQKWCFFKFHEPTKGDIALHLEQNFPQFIRPVTELFTHSPYNSHGLCMFKSWFMGVCRQIKVRWFPPAVYDTGHGFQFIMSQRRTLFYAKK